jgi:hypothetical protein
MLRVYIILELDCIIQRELLFNLQCFQADLLLEPQSLSFALPGRLKAFSQEPW